MNYSTSPTGGLPTSNLKSIWLMTDFPSIPCCCFEDSSYQKYCRWDIKDLGRDLLLIQPLVEFRHVVLSSHLSFHITEMMKKPLFFFIFFPNIPKQEKKKKNTQQSKTKTTFGVAKFAADCTQVLLVVHKHHHRTQTSNHKVVGFFFFFSPKALTGIKCCKNQPNPRMRVS